MKKISFIILIAFTVLLFIPLPRQTVYSNPDIYVFSSPLEDDPVYKEFINDAKTMKYLAEGAEIDSIPRLKLAYYTIDKKYDDIYSIAQNFRLNVDTVALINNLYSRFLFSGVDQLLISNMDGGFIQVEEPESLEENFGIPLPIIYRVNAITEINKGDIIFIPYLHMTKLQKLFFLGSAFLDPLRGKGSLSSLFGKRIDPINGHLAFHGGIDLACPEGTEVYASYPGIVIYAGWAGDYGNLVGIKHDLGYETYYGHLSEINVSLGQKVGYEDMVGLSGTTGKSTGPHLHFEIRYKGEKLNPLSFIYLQNQ